jgi:hypothetical protein
MRKSVEVSLAIAGAVVWIGAFPLALAAFGKEKSCGAAGTTSQRAEGLPERADFAAIEIHRDKLAACEKEGDERNLGLLPRRAFVYQCMHHS